MSDLHDDLSASLKELQAGNDNPTVNTVVTEPPSGEDKSAPKVAAKDDVTDVVVKEKPELKDEELDELDNLDKEKEPSEKKPEEKPAPASRAPVSWTPKEREAWDKLPPEVQATVTRREREINEALRTSSQARQLQAELQQTVQPFLPMIEAEGSQPLMAIKNLFNTAAFLRSGPAPQKAAMIADMIIQFGVDVNMLDTALSQKVRGNPGAVDPMNQFMQQIDQRLKPVTEFMSTVQQTKQQKTQQTEEELSGSIEDFMNDPANEFAADVAEDMADIIELASRRGQKISLQDAYKRATLVHPTISKVLEGRTAGTKAAQQTAAASRAKNAAASVTDSGAPSQNDEPVGDDIRSALLASVKQHQRAR